jgi:NAD(P)-dependent dehydrogenase (short-subunit alcohol dehydrogenase family)
MSMRNLSGTTAIVTGASRGFGRATAVSLAGQGAHVVGVARSQRLLSELQEQLGEAFTPEVADVTDPSLPARLLRLYRPQTLVLNAGATPTVGTLREQTWENFSANWNVDVFHVFNFTREALLAPLEPRGAFGGVSDDSHHRPPSAFALRHRGTMRDSRCPTRASTT